MKTYTKQSIALVALCLLPFVATAKTTIVQEYNFNMVGPDCEGSDCYATTDCSAFPYTCNKKGLKGDGPSCYNSESRKTYYKHCKCDTTLGYIPDSDVRIEEAGNGAYYAATSGSGSSGNNVGSGSGSENIGVIDDGSGNSVGTPVSDGGAICYKKSNIKCGAENAQYLGSSLPDSTTISAPITSTTIGSNECIKYLFTPLLSTNYKYDNILCLIGYSCNTAVGCYASTSAAVNDSQTDCFTTRAVLGDKNVNGETPTCYSPQYCKESGYCSASKPSEAGITYTEETMEGIDYNDKKQKSITCYKATGCINQWYITDRSNPNAFMVMITDTTIVPSTEGSHVSNDVSSLNRICRRWTGCNTADGWEEYVAGRGVGASERSARVVAAAYENRITYDVSVLSAGAGDSMHYFICRRPSTIVCQAGTYNDECSENNDCSWIKLFLPS